MKDIIDWLKSEKISVRDSVLDRDKAIQKLLPDHRVNNKINILLKNSLCYGITVTFKETIKINGKKYSFKKLDESRIHNNFKLRLHDYVTRYNKNVKFLLIPEIGSKNNRLHYHGIVSDYKINILKLIRWLKINFGNSKVEWCVRNWDNWVIYIKKDLNKTGLPEISNVFEITDPLGSNGDFIGVKDRNVSDESTLILVEK